jgi:hypothetical protein
MFKTEDNVHVASSSPILDPDFFSIPDPGTAKQWF